MFGILAGGPLGIPGGGGGGAGGGGGGGGGRGGPPRWAEAVVGGVVQLEVLRHRNCLAWDVEAAETWP